ncbi:glycosyltransferase family 2 protein [Crassaminicella profunda]|uniref:glycosyltransferase family 2 protein n=1 Tax=Crassaminicella profunda TaxID=1286698 RepID=UPI001CA71424|nr:glycosyltransferase family 2 protein [Crassaminicella profunda]QZY57019.1 glycosyltransferase [Crassaminicella profunda]
MKVSVIIPSYNSCERLYYNLISLNHQNYPRNEFEVIVIDNGSIDNTSNMLSEFNANYPLSIIRLKNNKGIAYARNKGILKSVGELLIFHDSDMIATKDFIKNHIEAHKDKNTVICGNCMRRIYSYYYKKFSRDQIKTLDNQKHRYNLNIIPYHKNKSPLITEEQIIDESFIDFSFDLNMPLMISMKLDVEKYGEELKGYNFPWKFFITNNCSVYKQNVIRVGLFDQKIIRYGFEDFDLGIRLYKLGCKFIIRHDILSIHQEHPVNFTKDDIWHNLYYICEKYSNPYFVEMLLVCSNMYTSIDPNLINEIMNDINQIKEMEQYKGLIDQLIEFLKILYKRHYEKYLQKSKKSFKNNKNERIKLHIDFCKIKKQGNELYELGLSHFVDTFYMLIKHVYGIDMMNVGI